ncbi:MAG: hypothetical protein EZS26_002770 [Candidatus Ordinivivax streblomastigis]|uniref:DUF4861 domain-containing protein n=1 Tax=Candidatus Ordinivivax streblomastigis TaxID=2540710 RepID=A0A5M8NWP1_9BACT|nr:MAG: hypothetical protein EZS26_002770 [Candidatus Ordinivivax streblomastigis]
MRKTIIIGIGLLFSGNFFLVSAQNQERILTCKITNEEEKERVDVPVVIDLHGLSLDFQVKSAIVTDGDVEITSQLDDLNSDRILDELAFVIGVPARTQKELKITFSSAKNTKQYPSRVYAEMLLRNTEGKHVPVQAITVPGNSNIYNQLHHHGPAFESEWVAYRLYFDQKQTVDIYGKFNKGFEIQESQFYPTDEQLARGFGDDVLRVGGSCGVGTLKGWNGTKAVHIEPVHSLTERILTYGPVRIIVEAEVNEWKYQGSVLNMVNRYILYAGHRDLTIETFFEKPLKEEIFCTGIQDIKGSLSYSDHEGLIACWGTDWPVNDTVKYAKETVGLAAYIPSKYVKKEVRDKINYLYTLSAQGESYIKHYATFTSLKETFGYKTPEEWFASIRSWKEELEHPLAIEIF